MTWVTGIDVSHYQSPARITDRAAAGDRFVFIKASEALFKDQVRYAHLNAAEKAGMAAGPYHFYRASKDPVDQANNFLEATRERSWSLPHVLDYEHGSGKESPADLLAFLETVEEGTGRTPVVYTGYYAWMEFIGDRKEFARFPLWQASYPARYKDGTPPPAGADGPAAPDPWADAGGWSVWQYSDSNGRLDRNVMTPATFALLTNTATQPSPTPNPPEDDMFTDADRAALQDLTKKVDALYADYGAKGKGVRQVILETAQRTKDLVAGKRPV